MHRRLTHKMINVGEYVRTKLEGDAFAEHLTRNAGGSSTQFLDTNTKGAATDPERAVANAVIVAKYLMQHGPGLVAHFHVDDVFGTIGVTKRDSFLDDQVGPSRGMHAMIVIGCIVSVATILCFCCKTGGRAVILWRCRRGLSL